MVSILLPLLLMLEDYTTEKKKIVLHNILQSVLFSLLLSVSRDVLGVYSFSSFIVSLLYSGEDVVCLLIHMSMESDGRRTAAVSGLLG